jgi:hypothetical protein
MTYEQAYAEGFCKAAEVAGVDPVALCKRAQALKAYSRLGALLSKARAGAQKGGKRYLELLGGGRPRFIEQVRQGLNLEHLGGPLESTKPLERLLGRLLAGRARVASRIQRIKGGPLENPADVIEARKALATQFGTGVGAAGAGAGLYALRDGEND